MTNPEESDSLSASTSSVVTTASATSSASAMSSTQVIKAQRLELRNQRRQLVLYRQPLATVYHASCELLLLLRQGVETLLSKRLLTLGLAGTCTALLLLYTTTHNQLILSWYLRAYEAVFWIFLGVLSSVGLGTGLHTFILYLGPYIAHVTMHAYSCGTTNLGLPFHSTNSRSWNSAVCPPVPEGGHPPVTIYGIVRAVQFQAFMWGAGTAIGELPPYFVARAARLSQEDPDDEDLEELHETIKAADDTLLGRAKQMMHKFVQRAGFWGIVLCASIPNPLFDLAGLTCGHFLIPFRVFFGATLIGKAFVKVHIQVISLVLVMSKPVFESILVTIKGLPAIGDHLYTVLSHARESAQAKFASDVPQQGPKTTTLSMVVATLVILMISYFAISILEQLAQKHRHRLDKQFLDKIKSQ